MTRRPKSRDQAEQFLQAVENLANAAATTVERLQESGFGFMAEQLNAALYALAQSPLTVRNGELTERSSPEVVE